MLEALTLNCRQLWLINTSHKQRDNYFWKEQDVCHQTFIYYFFIFLLLAFSPCQKVCTKNTMLWKSVLCDVTKLCPVQPGTSARLVTSAWWVKRPFLVLDMHNDHSSVIHDTCSQWNVAAGHGSRTSEHRVTADSRVEQLPFNISPWLTSSKGCTLLTLWLLG